MVIYIKNKTMINLPQAKTAKFDFWISCLGIFVYLLSHTFRLFDIPIS